METEIIELNKVLKKLYSETERLRGDISRLVNRIEPFATDSEKPDETKLPVFKHWTLEEALYIVDVMRTKIGDAEAWVRYIKAQIDIIENDSISRSEMRPYFAKNATK